MNLLLTGLNHQTASVEVRECLAPPEDLVPPLLDDLRALPGVREVVLISTCNRVEVLAAASDAAEAADGLRSWFVNGRTRPVSEVADSLYSYQDHEAVRHLFRVAASLDSMVLGEPQILGQIKEAYRTAADARCTGAVLNRLLHKTFQVAKRVRSETAMGGGAVSIAHAAVDLACKIFDPLKDRSALLIGAGEMAELAAEHLLGHGLKKVNVANRTLARAMELAGKLGGGKAYGLDELPLVLSQVDIVISSTGATEPVIKVDLAKKALKARRGRPLFFIDIAVPRDIEEAVDKLDSCFVYDIDDLSQVVDANRQSRANEAQAAEHIVAEEVVKFGRWLASLAVSPTIAGLTSKAENIRQGELTRTLKDLGDLPPEKTQALENLTRSLVKKLLHDPIMFIKEQSHAKSQETQRSQLAMVRRMFDLQDNDGE
jgi:glutamyl-tRNA reductase